MKDGCYEIATGREAAACFYRKNLNRTSAGRSLHLVQIPMDLSISLGSSDTLVGASNSAVGDEILASSSS